MTAKELLQAKIAEIEVEISSFRRMYPFILDLVELLAEEIDKKFPPGDTAGD